MYTKQKKENKQVSKDNIPVKVNGDQHMITIEAVPLPDIVEPHYLILFHNIVSASKTKGEKSKTKISSKEKKSEKDLRIEQLQQELALTR